MSKPRRTINANGDVVLVGGSGGGGNTTNIGNNGAGEMQQQQQQQSSESPFGSLSSSFNNIDWNQLPMMNRMLLGFGAVMFFLMFGRLLFPICMLLMMASYLSRNGSNLSGSGSGAGSGSGSGIPRMFNNSRGSNNGNRTNNSRRGGGSNIHGMADLPCDPRRG